MAARAKHFQNDSSRFPEEQREVLVREQGMGVILKPVDEWPPDFVEILGAWSEPIQRPRQRTVGKLRDPFR